MRNLRRLTSRYFLNQSIILHKRTSLKPNFSIGTESSQQRFLDSNDRSSVNKSLSTTSPEVDLFGLCKRFLELIPSKISTEQTELLSNYDNQEGEKGIDFSLVDRLFALLTVIENFENLFLNNKQILSIRDMLKEKNLELKNAPAFINNIRMRFNRAQQKLVSILKFSSQNFFRENTFSGELRGINLHSNLYYVDYSPSRGQNQVDQINSDPSSGEGKTHASRFSGGTPKAKVEKVGLTRSAF